MLWYEAFHVVFVVTWFSGLFYLPRLFVYHSMATDVISIERFKVMEKKLYYAILLPSAILATFLGIIVLSYGFLAYLKQPWMELKLVLVFFLWLYTFICGVYVHHFARNNNRHTTKFYRFFNEVPSLLLIGIIILVIVKPALKFNFV